MPSLIFVRHLLAVEQFCMATGQGRSIMTQLKTDAMKII